MKARKAQNSLEFLMVFGIGFAIILILGGLFFNYFNGEKNSLDRKQIDNIGNELISNIEKIYFLGFGNRVTMSTYLPEGIINFSIYHKENVIVNGKETSFDYINVTYLDNKEYSSSFFETNQNYIRFTCAECYHNADGSVSYINDSSSISSGDKRIRIESLGDYVEISFVK